MYQLRGRFCVKPCEVCGQPNNRPIASMCRECAQKKRLEYQQKYNNKRISNG